MNLNEPIERDTSRLPDPRPKIESEANSTAGKVFGMVVALSVSALMIMAVIKVGLIWFT